MMESKDQLALIKRIKALADTGLIYASNDYEKERYEELQEIGLQLIQQVTDSPLTVLKDFFISPKEYPTPKIDIRGLVLNERNEILLVREQSDGKWSLPGGWGEIGFSPSEVIKKEILEEAGLQAKAKRLLAVFDKKCHDHPPEAYYVYKMVFLCEAFSQELQQGFDIEDVAYFSVEELPQLSTNRILQSQIHLIYEKALSGELDVYFD